MTTDNTFQKLKDYEKMIRIMAQSGHFKTQDELKNCIINSAFYMQEDALKWGTHLLDYLDTIEIFHQNLAADVLDWCMTTDDWFVTTSVYIGLHLTTRSDKKNAVIALMRLETKGFLEKGSKGQYRRRTDDFKPLTTFEGEDTEPVPLFLPLGIDQYVKLFATNIVIIAGTKDAGKTAACLNIANDNSGNGRKVRYISSEFGAAELKDRLTLMDVDIWEWIKKIEFGQYQKSAMQDAIDPDGINIVDFLESADGQFYLVAEQIKQIYYKLRKGIAVIALQKKKGQEYARGGELSAEKARLYVTLDRTEDRRNVATILHCKNRAMPEINPNGLCCEYKLGGGHHFKREGMWLPAGSFDSPDNKKHGGGYGK